MFLCPSTLGTDTKPAEAKDVGMNGTQPEKTPGFGFGIDVLMLGVLIQGYVYLKKQ